MERYLMGLDGGGTKTEVLVCRLNGECVAQAVGGPASVTGQGIPEAGENIRSTIEQALRGLNEPVLEGFYAGISGAGLEKNRQTFRDILKEILPPVRVWDAGSDSLSALRAGIGTGDGVIAIAGTGSNVCAWKNGEMHSAGAWGYLLGDPGSGFDLGRRALVAALRDLDGRGEKTRLREMCETQAGCALRELVPRIYAGEAKKIIASFAPVLLTAAGQGDAEAVRQLTESAGTMAEAIDCVCGNMENPRVVLGGSVWKNGLYRECVRNQLKKNCILLEAKLPPAAGSVVQAAVLAGIDCPDTFLENTGLTWR